MENKPIALLLKNYPDLDPWSQTRAIDAHRANLRLLKCALRLAQRDDVNTVLYAHHRKLRKLEMLCPAAIPGYFE